MDEKCMPEGEKAPYRKKLDIVVGKVVTLETEVAEVDVQSRCDIRPPQEGCVDGRLPCLVEYRLVLVLFRGELQEGAVAVIGWTTSMIEFRFVSVAGNGN